MAYNAVSQADHELASNATDSDDSRGPSPQPRHPASFEQLPLDADHIGAGKNMQRAKTEEEDNGIRSLGSMIRSMTAASYDMVEEDDYEIAEPPARPDFNSPRSGSKNSPRRPLAPDAPPPANDHAEIRTPTTEHSVPLSHPTPDLQSLQGAYLNNVERLEKTAERLSLSSADIGSEIRKMDLEQKRRSSSSASNYGFAASQDGMPTNAVTSRRASVQSAARLAQVSEQAHEEYHEDSTTRPPVQPYLPPPPEPVSHAELDPHQHVQYDGVMLDVDFDRPPTAASTDTYQQARFLFTDFDGVHYVPNSELGRGFSLTRPPLASRPESYKEPQAGENMVYYPAPVPMMLNLPPRLSQRPANAEREKRRTQLLDSVPPENRKSAPWLADQAQPAGDGRRRTKQLSDLPPHLRASVFFEQPSAPLEIDPTQSSAVATLDSILDASTTAPVTAFTDHPFAGSVGGEVYASSKPKKLAKDGQGNKQRPQSSLALEYQHSTPALRATSLSTTQLHPTTEAQAAETRETTSLREHRRESDSESDGDTTEGSETSDDDDADDDDDDDDEAHFTGPPATLLAELEKRKHDLKQRRRTAANAVGLHSTLLQLEAVAQKQSEHRRQKPVALAWENPDPHVNEEDDDEDVPLGMLFPDKTQPSDETRPLGLMEKRELEESEPLSRRRARLRGEVLPRTPDKRPMTMYSQSAQALAQATEEDESGDEGETLGQRLRRLKGQERPTSKAESQFTAEILAELDNLHADENKHNQEEAPQEEETLAQRRARLKQEADSKRNSKAKIPRYRRSMADVLHARRPTTAGQQSLQETVPSHGHIHQRSFDNRMSMSMHQLPVDLGPPKTAAGSMQYQAPNMAAPYGYGMAQHPNTFYSDAILGNTHLSYAMPKNYHPNALRPVIDPGQREIIDRWRQGVL